MTAETARQLSENRRNQDLMKIFKEVTNYSMAGLNEFCYKGLLLDEVKKTLEDLGYEINETANIEANWISWR